MNNQKISPSTVLVVENDPLLRVLTVDIVEEAGFAALQANDADQALRILAGRSNVAILLTDIRISGSMNGIELAHMVRDRWPLIKIIGVSTDGRLSGADLPADSRFLRKPYPSHLLTSELQSMNGLAKDLPSSLRFYLDV